MNVDDPNEKPLCVVPSPLLTRVEAAQYLRIKPRTLAEWARTGRYGLKQVKAGRLSHYMKSDLDAFLEGRKQ